MEKLEDRLSGLVIYYYFFYLLQTVNFTEWYAETNTKYEKFPSEEEITDKVTLVATTFKHRTSLPNTSQETKIIVI